MKRVLAFTALLALPSTAGAEALRIDVRTETLSNGLRVVLSSDRSAPTVAIAVYYDVGSRNEEPGRSGFAHLFEHMMFEGSARAPKGTFDRLMDRYGNTDANGTTNEDRTNYYETLPSNALEMGLFVEADRMRALNVTPESFENQRAVVMEERRQSYENQAYALSYLRRDELAYGAYFPYAHSTIGEMSELRSATFASVRAFHSRYYVPDNAVLSVVGDIDADAALALVRRHFESIPRGDGTARFVEAAPLAAQTTSRRGTISDPLAPLPGFWLAYHTPARRHADSYALEVLSLALTGGQSSRLYRELVRNNPVANSVEVDNEARRGPSLFTVWCVLAEERGAARRSVTQRLRVTQSAADRVLDAVVREGISPTELDAAKNQLRSRYVLGLESNMARARSLAEHHLYDGDATLLRTELDRYLAVTRDDVRRVAAQYLRRSNRTVLEVIPAARTEGAAQ